MPTELPTLEAESNRILEGYGRIARALADRLPAVDTLPIIADEAARALEISTLVVAVLEEREYLRFVAVAGERAHELQGVRVRAADSVAERALTSGSSTVQRGTIESVSSAVPAAADAVHLSPSIAVVPVVCDGSASGAILAMGSELAPLDGEAPLSQLKLYADFVAAAITMDESERLRADQARELTVLHRASRSIGSSLNLQDILDSVLDAVCDHLDFQSAVVFLANDEQSHLFVAVERGLPEQDREVQLSAESASLGQVLASGRPRLMTRVEALPEFGALVRDERIRALLLAPILSRAERLGVLAVTSAQPATFTDNDLKLVEAVAANAGVAISNAWLYEDATYRAENTGALYDFSQRLNATLRAEAVHRLAVESALSLLNVDTGAVLVLDERSGRLTTHYAKGAHRDSLLSTSLLPGEGVPGWVFEWETPQSVADVAADPRNGTAPLDGIASLLAVPMATRDRALGVLLAATSSRRLFTVGEMELLYTVANQAAVSLSNATLYALERAKSSDMRRYFRRVARALGETVQGESVPRLFADLALALMRAAVCNVYLLEGETLKLLESASDRPSLTADAEVPFGEGLTGLTARRGQSIIVEELAREPRAGFHAWTGRHRLTSYLGVPLRAQKELRGIVEVYMPAPHSNVREEARLLAQFARLAKVAERLTPYS